MYSSKKNLDKCFFILNFGGFSNIHITFYKHISNANDGDNVQNNYLSIEPFLNLLTAFFVKKTKFLSNFFLNSEFGMRVYRGKIEARSDGISLYIFLRISPRKINILKKTKLSPRELNELNDKNLKKNAAQFNKYFEIYYKNAKKME